MGFRRTTAGIVALLCVVAVCGTASAVVITFEDLQAGSIYLPGGQFVTSTVPVTVSSFAPPGGLIAVGTSGLAAGAGNELVLSNAVANFAFPGVTTGLALQLAQLGTGLGVSINGASASVASLSQLNGMSVGGTQLFVPFVSPTGLGSLFVIGNVSQFAIGGTTVAIDNMVASWNVPEPASMGLLALGGLLVARRRRA